MTALALRRWRGVFGLALIAGIVWFLSPGPKEPARSPLQPDAWVLPAAADGLSQATLERLGKANLWGTLPDVAVAASLNEPDWRFIGIVTSGAERFVLIKTDGLPERRLNVNDILPGGSKILKIEEDSLCILVNGARRRLKIHNMGPQVL